MIIYQLISILLLELVYYAYFTVCSLAIRVNSALLDLNSWAISGINGSSGLGSSRSEQIDRRTLVILSAGLHWSFNMSKQMPPVLLILGW